MVHQPRSVRQVLANPQPRHTCRNRVKLTADFRRCFRLHVECVEMAGATVMEDQDARADWAATPVFFVPPATDPSASARSNGVMSGPAPPNHLPGEAGDDSTGDAGLKYRAVHESFAFGSPLRPSGELHFHLERQLFNIVENRS